MHAKIHKAKLIAAQNHIPDSDTPKAGQGR